MRHYQFKRGGMRMKRLSGWMRLAVGVSIFWFVSLFLFGLILGDAGLFALFATIPLLVVWAVWWIVEGFKSTKADEAADEGVTFKSVTRELRDLEAKVRKIETNH
jgi:hypothetical protein